MIYVITMITSMITAIITRVIKHYCNKLKTQEALIASYEALLDSKEATKIIKED